MPYGIQTVVNCQICGKEFPSKTMVINDIEGQFIYTCPQCYSLLPICPTCEYNNTCGFNNDHTEPHMVQQTIRRGMMNMSTQVKNPNLVQKHCTICRCGTMNGQDVTCEKERDNGFHCPNHKILTNLF